MLRVFSVDIYALLDLGATLSFVTPWIARNFDMLLDILDEPFMVTILVGESVVEMRVYRNCPIMLPNRVNHAKLVELYMVHFDVIFGSDWLHNYFASIDYTTRMVKFNFPNETVLEWKGGNSTPSDCIISCLKVCKIISKGCFYHIVRVKYLDSKNPII